VTELIDISKSTNERRFLQRVQSTIWNRTLFTIGDEAAASFGLGPADTSTGDEVFVVPGCSVQVVLRGLDPCAAEVEQFSTSRRLMGECFALGYMDGEAITNTRNGAETSITIF
jgi:hypothetical protein